MSGEALLGEQGEQVDVLDYGLENNFKSGDVVDDENGLVGLAEKDQDQLNYGVLHLLYKLVVVVDILDVLGFRKYDWTENKLNYLQVNIVDFLMEARVYHIERPLVLDAINYVLEENVGKQLVGV